MAFQWPTEEPVFKKLTEEEINRMSYESLETQLGIDKRNRLNYRNKVIFYAGFLVPFSWLFPTILSPSFTIPLFYFVIVLLFDLLCVWLSIRSYRKLVREVRPQVARLTERLQDLSKK
ncbi:MAG: hypothetical protein ACRDF4_01030 [Rhabdochlamydiaceae bacterium]